MADKAISELIEAKEITATDLFVLEQASTAKKLSGQTMTTFLLKLAEGHGGITNIAKTAMSGWIVNTLYILSPKSLSTDNVSIISRFI